VAERIYSERLNWVGGMRVAYTLLEKNKVGIGRKTYLCFY
jgi:hypothetical protein